MQVGYTHANWIYTNTIIDNVESYDFTSSYPYVMVTHKFPAGEFRKCNITNKSQILDCFAYILLVKFKNIKCKYYNNFISQNKCRKIKNARYDNGRIISADEIEIVLTDIDFKFILETYSGTYAIIESYFTRYEYLPIDYIKFILEKYVKKTEYKNVKDKEIEYALEKAKFNSLYGMTVTNNIKDNVIFDNINDWSEVPLSNDEIIEMLEKEKKQAFLSFSYGVWVTSWARYNLLSNVIQLDKDVIYCDTDSIKVKTENFDKKVIDNYNKKVIEKIEKASEELEIDIEKFMPKDKKGIKRILGVFDNDAKYKKFITQGAKKYAYIDSEDNQIHITVAGVPKSGAKALKTLDDFRDDFLFEYQYTNKNLLSYEDNMSKFNLKDFRGKKYTVSDVHRLCINSNNVCFRKITRLCRTYQR